MTRYVIKRLLIMIPLLIAVGVIMYTLMEFVPGDPVDIVLSTGFHTEEEKDLMREAMGLNRPFVVRLGDYIGGVFLHFDFGTSLLDGTSIKTALINRFPNTLYIAIFSILLTVVVGLPLGIYTAVHANSLGDKVSLFVTLLFDCMPSFWTALLLVLLFSVKLGWLPSSAPPSGSKSLVYFILPTLANSLGGLAGFTRQVRASMLEVIRSDYVTTARSKGLPEHDVVYGHALPNALIPILTVVGMILLAVIIILCILSPYICPWPYAKMNIAHAKQGPSLVHLLGTDHIGRDLLSRVLYGARYTLIIGITVTIISAVLGILMGAVAGYFGGFIDSCLMRFLDIFQAFPTLILAMAFCAIFGKGVDKCIWALGIFIVITVLSFNLIGDAFRDALDPKFKD